MTLQTPLQYFHVLEKSQNLNKSEVKEKKKKSFKSNHVKIEPKIDALFSLRKKRKEKERVKDKQLCMQKYNFQGNKPC